MANLFRHYKNKPYRYLGEVRHSESLEMLVLYETRYDNDLGRLWVRPREMFFSEVQVNGTATPRFAKVAVSYEEFVNPEGPVIQTIRPLLDQVFGTYSEDKLNATLRNRTQVFLVVARADNQVVGFKLGYTYNNERFYSWLGAVHPEYRGVRIGQDLMDHQHRWCQKQGFAVIETRTKNTWREMLLLNLKNGFNIVGTYTNRKGLTKIILEKDLTAPETPTSGSAPG